jgi:hypothetical protein
MRAKMESNHRCYPSGGVSKDLERDLMSQQPGIVAFFDAEAPKLTHSSGTMSPVILGSLLCW